MPITVAARSQAWTVFARSNVGIVGSNPTQGVDVCLHLFCVCVYSGLASGWSPIQGVLPTLLRWRNRSETKRFTDALCFRQGQRERVCKPNDGYEAKWRDEYSATQQSKHFTQMEMDLMDYVSFSLVLKDVWTGWWRNIVAIWPSLLHRGCQGLFPRGIATAAWRWKLTFMLCLAQWGYTSTPQVILHIVVLNWLSIGTTLPCHRIPQNDSSAVWLSITDALIV
jgi:hypothetical protein